MSVPLLQYKRDDTVVVVEPWLMMSTLLFKALNYAGNLRAPIHVTDGSVLFLIHPKHYSCRSEFYEMEISSCHIMIEREKLGTSIIYHCRAARLSFRAIY